MEGHEALVAQLRANPPVAPERLRRRVLEGAPAPRAAEVADAGSWCLVVVPAAVVLAVGAALVHGFVSSGSARAVPQADGEAHALPGLNPRAYATDALPPASGHGRSTGACQCTRRRDVRQPGRVLVTAGQRGRAADAPRRRSSSCPARRAVTIPRNRLVHAVATLQVGVKSTKRSRRRRTRRRRSYGARRLCAERPVPASHKGDGESFLDLRVPLSKTRDRDREARRSSARSSRSRSRRRISSAKLTQQTSGIGRLRRAIAVYKQALQSGTLTPRSGSTCRSSSRTPATRSSGTRKARNDTVASGRTADISLTAARRANHAAVAPAHDGAPARPDAPQRRRRFLALEGIIVLYALIVGSPDASCSARSSGGSRAGGGRGTRSGCSLA